MDMCIDLCIYQTSPLGDSWFMSPFNHKYPSSYSLPGRPAIRVRVCGHMLWIRQESI